MASLLATIIGGVVDINMDMMTSTGVIEGNGLDYAVVGTGTGTGSGTGTGTGTGASSSSSSSSSAAST